MVSMMQTIQSGARPTFYPGRVDWPTPDGSQLGFTNRGADGELRNVGVLVDIGLAQGMELDDDLELLFVMTEDLLDATKDNMRVAAGRRADPAGGYHGYVVWQRRRTPNHPRMEISPDQVITLWYHWPNGDDQPLQPCPASTIFAGSCCLIEKCYRNFSTWGPLQSTPFPAVHWMPLTLHQSSRKPAFWP